TEARPCTGVGAIRSTASSRETRGWHRRNPSGHALVRAQAPRCSVVLGSPRRHLHGAAPESPGRRLPDITWRSE
ncbi:unnamed protein product, partial [Musa textilis]